MTWRVALVAVLITGAAAAQDRPAREVVEVSSAVLLLPSGQERQVIAGAWLSDPTMIDVAKELVALRAEVGVLREAPPTPPFALIYTASVALLVGLGVGVLAGRELAK